MEATEWLLSQQVSPKWSLFTEEQSACRKDLHFLIDRNTLARKNRLKQAYRASEDSGANFHTVSF